MPKHDGGQPVLVYSRAYARDDHYLVPCISEAQHEVVHDVLAHIPRANFELRVLRETQDHHRPQESHQGGDDESHSSMFVQ